MATLALPVRRGALAGMGTGIPLAIGMTGTVLSWFGAGWDVSWHRIFGRDTFWSAPHLFIYTGVALWGIAALLATFTAMAGRPVRGRAMEIGPFRAELGFALIGFGALVTILAGPFDNLWHAAFGRDVDIWSPPHVAGIAGGVVGLLGWVAAFQPGVFRISEPLRRTLLLVTLGNIGAITVFAMNFYYITASTREGFFYPLLVIALVPFTLGVAAVAMPGRWSATAAAAAYTAIALVAFVMLAGSGWRAPAFPPLIVAGALAIDLARGRGESRPFVLALLFAIAFVAAELARMVLVPPPVPGAALGGVEPRLSTLFMQYYKQAVARPWLSLWPWLAAIVGAPFGAAAWRAGRSVASRLANDPDAEPLAHP
jgi:hypothetical protein